MSGRDPRRAVAREAAGGDEEMDVRMILERARPGVEDREDPDRAADPGAIVGEGLHGGRGLAEERGIDDPLMGARDARSSMREREGE